MSHHPDRRQAGAHHVVPSTVSVMNHPVHPMLVTYPIALLSLTLPSDIAYLLLGDPFWARASFLMLLGGLGFGLLAAAVGMIDFFTMKRVRSHVSGWSHFVSAIVLLALAAANLNHRWVDHAAAVVPWGLVLSTAMAMLVVITGWLGGTLSFGHAIGSFEHEQDVPPDDDSSPPRE
jgi:uncharacterized membrane protein